MARIRSIHPGAATDEDLAQCSFAARWLWALIGTEADDRGIFEWKPIRIKMRLFPADDIHVEPLLAELVEANRIFRYETGGKAYGAIRNFCKFQRPKSPKESYPRTPAINEYIGLAEKISPESGNDATSDDEDGANDGNVSADGGDKMEDVGDSKKDSLPNPPRYVFAGRVVKLNQADYDRWRSAYHGIADFPAALQSADDWISGEGEKTRSRWFSAVSAFLGKRHEAAMSAHKPSERPATRGSVGAI